MSAPGKRVLAMLQVASLGKCDDQGLGPWGWPFSCLPNLVADRRIVVRAVITTSPPAWTSSAGMLSHTSSYLAVVILTQNAHKNRTFTRGNLLQKGQDLIQNKPLVHVVHQLTQT